MEPNVTIPDGIQIGAYTFIGRDVIIGPATKSVGRFCSIAPRAIIGPNSHYISAITTSNIPLLYSTEEEFFHKPKESNAQKYQAHKEELNKKNVIIEDDVWIGHNAIILPGVKVSIGTIIAAGSVVTKDTEPYSIVAGIPSRFLRYRFRKETIEAICNSKIFQKKESDIIQILSKYSGLSLEDHIEEILEDIKKL
ncbi:CatB-related O-acetyltransferase [Thalassospira australica]|uniref:CatB-related O-acetyltransferase n=1 Tax=Thalassospira australica TaxID=1528106 RepID=UPI00384C394A